MKRFVIIICAIVLIQSFVEVSAQEHDLEVQHIEPPNWWVGMKNKQLQLMIHAENVGEASVTINHKGVELVSTHKADNPNYLFLDLMIKEKCSPGLVNISFQLGEMKFNHKYELKSRNEYATNGISQSDVIYLITPDRFVNANPENDQVDGLKEGLNRSNSGGRHGGDLKGVISKVDYLNELGITTLWLNPVVSNDMNDYSYHGYAITDYYQLDARYGTNKQYLDFSNELHSKGMKLIMDMVFNHCGLEHWWMKDKPFDDWVHHPGEYRQTNHALAAVSDPHASMADLADLQKGWFVPTMPDLNHDNLFMTNYLIQNSIWWVEYAGLDGIRMDTYPYNEKLFMGKWAERLFAEYPNFYMVGETWIGDVAQEAYWGPKDPEDKKSFNSGVSSITDFPLQQAIHNAFKPNGNIRSIYDIISKDFLYYQPRNNKIFVDNHDMDRFYHVIDEDISKYKIAMTFLLTTRGIPQIYYGTEILLRKFGKHGDIREDFPGGWIGDERNAFIKEGRNADENEAFDHVQNLLTWRKNSDAIQNGELTHFVPINNIYVFSRSSEKESVVVIINNGNESTDLDMARFSEIITNHESATDIVSGIEINDLKKIPVKGNQSLVLQLHPPLKSEKK